MTDSRESLTTAPFQRAATICSAGVLLCGLLGLGRWHAGVQFFSDIMPAYIPMAASTAYSFLLLGAVLLLKTRGSLPSWGLAGARAMVGIVLIFSVLILLQPFISVSLSFEDKLFPPGERIGEVITNRMSPLTALTLLMGGTSLLLILGGKDQAVSWRLGGFLGCLVAIIGFIGIIGYLFGRPLYYGGVGIPMALSTASAFLLLGAGLMAGAGPGAPPLRLLVGPSTRARLLRVFLPLMMGAILIHGLLHEHIMALFRNQALGASMVALGFALITGGIVALVSRTLSRTLDLAEAERSQVQEALRDSEEKYRRLIETTKTGYVILDFAGKVLDANLEYVRLTGHKTLEEILGRNVIDWTAEQDRSRNGAEVKKCLQSGSVTNLEINYTGEDGRFIPVEINATTITTSEGLKILSLVRDITERKQAQAALEESLSLYKVTLDSTADGILVVNRQGEIVSANHKFQEMWCIPEDIITSGDDERALSFVLDQLAAPQNFLQKVRELYAQPAAESFDILHFKNGRVFERYSLPQYLDDRIVGRVWSFRDVTLRTRAEQALRDHSHFLQTLLDTIPSPVFYKNVEGVYLGCNQAFSDFLGFAKEAIIGKTVYDISPQDLADRYFESDADLFEQPGVQAYDYSVLHADGTMHDVYFSKATYATTDGTVAGLVGVMIDITDRKKSEEERLRFSKLESLATLAGGIAHDFNNILTAILGNIGLAMLEGKISDRLQGKLVQAEQACLRAKALAQQLLTFAKGGAPITTIISIARLLKESVTLTLSGSRSRCELSIPGDLWSVTADEGQINQVVSNLLLNADQAMPEGGIIIIKAENILVGDEPDLPLAPGKYVKLSFTDHGTGIAPQYLDKVFDPYFTTKQKGSGLGLATAYSIIKNHSGHIRLESRIGVGTTFYIYLPAMEIGPPAQEPKKAVPLRGLGRILAMDDEQMIQDVLKEMLIYLGYEVDCVGDGSQAIDKFAQAQEAGQPFAAVILDLTVPGAMGGKDAIKEILKLDPQVKAIVSSGYSDDPIMADFSKYGFSAVIAKPYRVLELSKILQRVITGEAN